jgi:HSP20 family protein
VTKDGTDVVIMLELPGIDVEKDVDIEVAQGRLTITGERQERRIQREGEDDQRGVLVRELRYGSFRREFALPEHVKAEDVDAGYDRGMLFRPGPQRLQAGRGTAQGDDPLRRRSDRRRGR